MIVKNKIGEIILLIFLLICGAIAISAFTMNFSSKSKRKYITSGTATMTYYNS